MNIYFNILVHSIEKYKKQLDIKHSFMLKVNNYCI